MKEHEINQLNNFIAGWYDDTEICDKLISFHKNSPNKQNGKVGNPENPTLNSKIKESTDCYLSPNENLFFEYISYVQRIVDRYRQLYPYSDYYGPWSIIEDINVQHYKPGQAFHAWHTERIRVEQPQGSRHLVFMTYLNDVTDCGETEFFHQNIKIKPEKGLTIIWPADWTFTHRGVPSLTQEKYITTGWFNYVSNFPSLNQNQ